MFTKFPNLESVLAHAKQNGIRERVICYITRNLELLVFEHGLPYPTAGIQVPAGGLEVGESIFEAATREATEATGLMNLEIKTHLGSGLYKNGNKRQIWHFVWLMTQEPRDSWQHFAEDFYYFDHRFVPLEKVILHYDMEAFLPELGNFFGLELHNRRMSPRPCVICYITRQKQGEHERLSPSGASFGSREVHPYTEILTFSGHPDGGIGVPAGGIEDGETPDQAAIREILEESGLTLEHGVYLGRQDYYFKGNHPENGTPLEFLEDRYYYWFATVEPRDSWEWVVSDGVDDKGKVFKHSFVPLEQAQIDWDMDEFIGELEKRFKP